MVKEFIEIPGEIEAKVDGNILEIKGKEGTIRKEMRKDIKLSVKDGKVILERVGESKRERKMINSARAHVKNMMEGVKQKYVYKLQICSVHFPMNVSIDKVKNDLVIKNFLGEKKERRSRIMPNTNVKIEGDVITVDSPDVEAAGQTAANMEIITKIRNRDRRVFQDGIWMTEKAGVKLE
jgi:large subunit ribosomal protein L6